MYRFKQTHRGNNDVAAAAEIAGLKAKLEATELRVMEEREVMYIFVVDSLSCF